MVYYPEDNPQLLACGRNDKSPACSTVNGGSAYKGYFQTRISDRRVEYKDTSKLTCPAYYEPAPNCDTDPSKCVKDSITGNKYDTATRHNIDGTFKSKMLDNGKDHRYMRLCQRQQFKIDDVENQAKCCFDEFDVRDNISKLSNNKIFSTNQPFHMNNNERSQCGSNFKVGSKTCDAFKQTFCTDPQNINTNRCIKWAKDNASGESAGRIGMQDQAMINYCKVHINDPKCSCLNPKGFSPPPNVPNMPQCFFKGCVNGGYQTQDMKNKKCPNVKICTQNLTTQQNDHLVMTNVSESQDCSDTDNSTNNVINNLPTTPHPDDAPAETTIPSTTPTFDPDNADGTGAPAHDPTAHDTNDAPQGYNTQNTDGAEPPTTEQSTTEQSTTEPPPLIQTDKDGNKTIGGIPMNIFIVIMLFIVIIFYAMMSGGDSRNSYYERPRYMNYR